MANWASTHTVAAEEVVGSRARKAHCRRTTSRAITGARGTDSSERIIPIRAAIQAAVIIQRKTLNASCAVVSSYIATRAIAVTWYTAKNSAAVVRYGDTCRASIIAAVVRGVKVVGVHAGSTIICLYLTGFAGAYTKIAGIIRRGCSRRTRNKTGVVVEVAR